MYEISFGRSIWPLILPHRCRAIDEIHGDQGFESHGEHRVIHYYCTGSKPGEARSTRNLCLRALIRQLARLPHTLLMASAIRAEYDKRKMDGSSDCAFTDKECEKLLEELIPNDPERLRFTIIIDALDELEDDDSQCYELLRSLENLVRNRPLSIRLLLSSHKHVRIGRDRGIVIIDVVPALTKDDMQNFIKGEIERRTDHNYPGFLEHEPDLKEKVEKEISDKAMGMFQWAKLRIALFFPKPPLESPEKVERELRLLRTANPKDLDEVYQRLYMDNNDERQNTAKTYRIILSAYQPLTIAEVAEAVSIEADGTISSYVNTEYIRIRCHDFVVENEDGFLEFAHESARLFLENTAHHGRNNFADVDDFSDSTNHRQMAKTCVQLMEISDHLLWKRSGIDPTQWSRKFGFKRLNKSLDSGWDLDYYCGDPTFAEIFKRRGFVQYVCLFWIQHCRDLSSKHILGQELSTALYRVFSKSKTAFFGWCALFSRLSYKICWKFECPWELRWLFFTIFRSFDSYLISEANFCIYTTVGEAGSSSPHPLLAVCAWDFDECLDQHSLQDSLREENWSSTPLSPLHVCCAMGSTRVLSRLIEYYPEKVLQLISERSVHEHKLPIHFAIRKDDVDTVRAILDFWQGRAVPEVVSSLLTSGTIQVENSSPRRHEDSQVDAWTHLPFEDESPLQTAARYASVEVIALLLQAGARSSISSSTSSLSPIALALERNDEITPDIVEVLLLKDPGVAETFTNDDVLYYLAYFAAVPVARLILRNFPEFARIKTINEETALMLAISGLPYYTEDPKLMAEQEDRVKFLEGLQQAQDRGETRLFLAEPPSG